LRKRVEGGNFITLPYTLYNIRDITHAYGKRWIKEEEEEK